MGINLETELNLSALRPNIENCRFCDLAMGKRHDHFFDKQLARTPHFSVIASLGAMVPGWVLVVPTNHILNLSDLYVDHEMSKLRASISQTLINEFSLPVCMFEHGATRRGSQIGCGVDHAHLHVVPFQKSLRHSILNFNDSLVWNEIHASEIKSIVGESEYLFYSDDVFSLNPTGILTVVTEATSQFFRRVIARELDLDNEYDYRSNYFEEHIRQTQLRLGKHHIIESRL